MKIVKFEAENIKKLRVVTIEPDGSVVQITGKNGSGKTSVLDAIYYALGGERVIDGQPVRKGAKHGMVRLTLDDLIVSRRFVEDGGTTLQVESRDNRIYRSPQDVLNKLMGKLTFDPLAFQRLKPREQLDQLRAIAPVDIDLDKLAAENAVDYAARTDINREEKRLRAEAAGIVVPDGLGPKLDADELLLAIEKAGDANTARERRLANRNEAALTIRNLRAQAQTGFDEAARLRARAAELEKTAQDAVTGADDLQAKLDGAEPLPDVVDVGALRQQYDAAVAHNRLLEAVERQKDLLAQAFVKKEESEKLTARMLARDQQRAEAIARAPLPVPGLGFGDGMVTFNGLPFSQASGAEQLRVSVAIAMAMNPELRILRIVDGSLLDDDSLRLLTELATEHDYQVWIEMVDSSGTVGVVMEDGEVKAVHPSDAA